jgi:hypothetical protein
VELFERIRRDRELEGLGLCALARRHGVHRRTVRQALLSAIPPERKRPVGRSAPALGAYRELIDSWLIADRSAPPKQRHTAKRVHQRLVEEHDAGVAETTVRDYVRGRKRELGLTAQAYCPRVHDPGVTAEVDWGEAKVVCRGADDGGAARPRHCCVTHGAQDQARQPNSPHGAAPRPAHSAKQAEEAAL